METKKGMMECKTEVEGTVVPKLIQGFMKKKYYGREVVVCLFPPGLFGTRATGRSRQVECTLNGGLLNQCSVGKEGERPTPYWAVLDAACTLKRDFTRKDVINLAVKLAGDAKVKACEMAWDVLRNHHRHARKKNAGMTFMIEAGENGKLFIRARDEGETLQYFEAQVSRRAEAEAIVATPVPEAVPVAPDPVPANEG